MGINLVYFVFPGLQRAVSAYSISSKHSVYPNPFYNTEKILYAQIAELGTGCIFVSTALINLPL